MLELLKFWDTIFLVIFGIIILGYGGFVGESEGLDPLIDSMISVESDKTSYFSNQDITITVNSGFDPNLDIKVTITDSDDKVVFSQSVTTDPMFASFQFPAPDKEGTYYVNAVATKFGDDMVTAQNTFDVQILSSGGSLEQNENELIKAKIPLSVKDKAKYWSQGSIDEVFMAAIQWLLEREMIVAPPNHEIESSDSKKKIPKWVKSIALWWSEDKTSDDEFIDSIQWLVDKKVIQPYPSALRIPLITDFTVESIYCDFSRVLPKMKFSSEDISEEQKANIINLVEISEKLPREPCPKYWNEDYEKYVAVDESVIMVYVHFDDKYDDSLGSPRENRFLYLGTISGTNDERYDYRQELHSALKESFPLLPASTPLDPVNIGEPTISDFYVTYVWCTDFNIQEMPLYGMEDLSKEQKTEFIELLTNSENFWTLELCSMIYDADVFFDTESGFRIYMTIGDGKFSSERVYVFDNWSDNTDEKYEGKRELLAALYKVMDREYGKWIPPSLQ